MTTPDLINGTYEALGGFALWLNVKSIWKAKRFEGVKMLPTAFFASWGYWNLYYYPHLNQWMSFFGGINIVAANTTWLLLMWKFRKN